MKVVSPYTMKLIDKKAIEDYGIPGIVLMENAGMAVADMIDSVYQACHVHGQNNTNVAIFCGKGNNGGDGFVAARHLVNRGYNVRVFILHDAEDISGDALTSFNIIGKMGIYVKVLKDEADLANVRDFCNNSFAVIDAIFGTGFGGEIKGVFRSVIDLINCLACKVISIDIPSGISGYTGKIAGIAVKADYTVTMALPKVGLLLYPGAAHVGELTVADIGIPKTLIDSAQAEAVVLEKAQIKKLLKPIPMDAHKGIAGKVFILAGSEGMTGAAALTGLSAARSGAGLVTVGIPKSLNEIMEVKLTEAMTMPLHETKNRSISIDALEEALAFVQKCDAVALGPGISLSEETKEFVKQFTALCPVPIVLDADGLNVLAENPEIFKRAIAPLVITPHAGEMSRLLSKRVETIQNDRLTVVKEAAKKFECVTVLKGANTLIADSDGHVWINPTGNYGMATGGSGDVLTGIITAFLARGMKPVDAARAGVYIHGLSGDKAALAKGHISLIANDIIDNLAIALKEIY
ncbi:MAG: NAD(P)H-hydrate dehydratase [Thermoanaerobacterales bacterium]|nr:NAD(P)H-hydrate dehydratase [Thermoanaerobacterales bacterium]